MSSQSNGKESAISVGFSLEGMAGPSSGTWSRFKLLVEGLVSFGVEVHILGESGEHDAARYLGASSVRLVPKLSKFQRMVGRRKRLSRFARDSGAQILHLEAPPFIGLRDVPTLATVHDLRHFHLSGKFELRADAIYQRYVLKKYAPHIAGWLSLSKWGRRDIHRKLGVPLEKIFELPPIVEKPAKTGQPRALAKRPFALALGHVEPRKNLGTLIRATQEVEWPDGLELWIAGADHGSKGQIEKIVGSGPGRPKFLGPVSDTEKWRLLSEAELVVVPSLVEGFGIVAVEAALAGSLVLVSDRSALPELAAHPLAVVPALKPAMWAERISTLRQNPSLKAEIHKAQVASALHYRTNAIVPRLIGIYQNLLE